MRLLDLRECRRVAEENRDLVVGIKVRVGKTASGNSGVAPLDMALEVADRVQTVEPEVHDLDRTSVPEQTSHLGVDRLVDVDE